MERNDKLIVKGLDSLNGEYAFDLIQLISIGTPGALTGHEARILKEKAGVRGAEIEDAVQAGDLDVFVVIAAVVMMRQGKRFDLNKLWDATWGECLNFELDTTVEEAEDDAVPPVQEPPATEQSATLATSGGGSGSEPSERPQASLPSPTGPRLLATPTSAPDSDPETLAV